jgi:hypothetical protein
MVILKPRTGQGRTGYARRLKLTWTGTMTLKRIVSGGQTGVDRGALKAGLGAGVPVGGWCPRGRRAEDGAIPDMFPLHETESADYRPRTRLNVRDSDGTLILAPTPELTGGTALTKKLALAAGKPLLVVELGETDGLQTAVRWIKSTPIAVLNVAGPRESLAPGIEQSAQDFIASMPAEIAPDLTD